MSLNLFTNNASTFLASGIVPATTTLSLTPGTGVLFPTPGAGQVAVVTVEDTSGNMEIMWCTGRSGDTLTVTRAQEGTTALTLASGSRVELRCTAGVLTQLLQKTGGDTLSGTTNVAGVLAMGSGGSLQGGEYAGGFVRKAAGDTAGQIYVDGTGTPKSGTATILTGANLATNMPAGFGLVVSGMILMWYGSSASIPAGYHLCDGSAGTPNLTDKFVIGAGGTFAPAFGSTGGQAGGQTTANAAVGGSTDAYVLTVTDIPAHHHALWVDNSNDTDASVLGWTNQSGIAVGGKQISTPPNTPAYINVNGASAQIVQDTGGGGGHSHTMSASSHAHVQASGVTALPPFVGLFYIMKT